MPFIADDSGPTDVFSFGDPTLQEQRSAAMQVVPRSYNALEQTAGDIGLAPVDLVDQLASSKLVSWATGVNRGDINEKFLGSLNMPGLSKFYDENREGISMVSGIAGIVGAELATRGLLTEGGPVLAALSKVPYVRRVATLDMEYRNALDTVRNVDVSLARRGAMGIEAYTGEATVDALQYANRGGFAKNLITINRDKAVLDTKILAAAKGARHAITVEALMGSALNQNDFLYTDSAAQNMAWMGLGVALGAGAEWLHGAYQIRKMANSEMIKREFAAALDPDGLEEGRLLWKGKNAKPLSDAEGYLGGTHTDLITNLLVGAARNEETPLGTTVDARNLLAQRERLATQNRKLAREVAQKVTTKGITTDGLTRFSMDAPFYGNHLDMMMLRDPASLNGVEMLGGVPDNKTTWGIHEAHTSRLEERIQQAQDKLTIPTLTQQEADDLNQLIRRLHYEKSLTPFAVIDGEKMPISEAAAIEGFQEPKVLHTPTPGDKEGRGLWESEVANNSVAPVSIDSDFTIHIPSGKNLNDADHFDVLRLYRAANAAIEKMKNFKTPIVIPSKPNWFQLDMAEEILRRSDGAAPIQWPAGMTRDSAQVESLAQKAQAMQKWQSKLSAQAIKAAAKGQDVESQLSKLRVRFNLPRLTAYERGVTGENQHPVEALLRGIMAYGPSQIRQMGINDLRDAMAQFKRLGDIAPVAAKDMENLGNSFRYMLDESNREIKPLIGYQRPFDKKLWNTDFIAERLAARKMLTVETLLDPKAGELSQALTSNIINSPDFELASQPHKLIDTQVQGNVIGVAPQTYLGTVTKSLVTSEQRDRDNPVLLAATRLFDAVNRKTRDFMRDTITNTFGDILGRLENPRNAASNVLINQFHSFAPGWDLAQTPVQRPGGFWGFELADTEKNKARWKQQFGGDMPKGQTLLSPQGKEVVLDDLALDAQRRFNIVSDTLVNEKNTILRANGMRGIDRVNWYVPPPNTNGKLIGFVIGPDGKPVPGMTVVASTPREFNDAKALIMADLQTKGLGYVFRTQDEIRDFASIWDRAQMDMINPGTTAVQPGKTNRGALASNQVSLKAFNDSLTYLRDQFLNHSKDVLETLMKEQLNSSKARANMATELSRNRGAPEAKQRLRSIYDYYIENLTGRSKLQSEGSVVGKLLNPIEGAIDKVLTEATPTVASLWEATNGWINKTNPWSKSAAAARDFNTLSQKLGPYMPFANAAELLEKQGHGARPWTTAQLSGNLNQFAAAMLLRMFEVAHPIMNLAGMVNALPAVVRHFDVKDGELLEDYAARVGHAASIFNLPNGQNIGVLNMGKLGAKGFARALNAKSEADYAYMVSRGYLSQEVAEFHRQFGAIESKSSWQKFFLGDHTISNPQNFGEKLATKGLVGWLSILSDKSEDMSRAWGHMTGLELADILGITGLDAKHAFAHDVANKMIANYSPQNRPEIFQGAMGSVIGLFQSFIQNYYQRMFRYIETKDYGSLMWQYGTQSALFGITSVPGWHEFNMLMQQAGGGAGDPTSEVHHRLGPLGDFVAGGVISNIPRVFGQDAVDLYSRGDTSIRLPGTVTVPALAVVSKVMQGVGEAAQAFAEPKTLTKTQLAEIMSNMVANRPLGGMIEQFLSHGNDTDGYGQLVSDTKNHLEAVYRLMGLRSERQSREVEAYYANKNAMTHKAAADEVLRIATRSALREGNTDALPGIYQQYLDNGGDPSHFRRWLQDNYKAATSTRGERQLQQMMKRALSDPNAMEQVIRLMDAGVSVNADEETPDPGELYGQDQEPDVLDQPTTTLGDYPNQLTMSDTTN